MIEHEHALGEAPHDVEIVARDQHGRADRLEIGEELHDLGRELRIALSAPAPGRLRIAVSDSGTGIDPEQLPKLFSPFFTTKRDGMGIGLAICRTIVESHGGTLTARNNDGPGATFAVDLPAAEPDRESRAAEPAAANA